MKTLYGLILTLTCHLHAFTQAMSAGAIEKILTSGKTQSWYTHPVIIDVPTNIPYSVVTFTLSGKKGDYYRHGRGRDVHANTRTFTWKVEASGNDLILVLSTTEKYRLTISRDQKVVVVLEALQDNRRGRPSIAGTYYEEPFDVHR